MITEDGIYDLPMSEYHTQCCDGPSISSSGLRKIYNDTPADFWAYSDLNPDRYEQPDKKHFVFGRAAHAFILGDVEFDKHFAIIGLKAPKQPTTAQVAAREQGRISATAKESFDYWDEFEAEHGGKDWLKAVDIIHIHNIARQLDKSPLVTMLDLLGGEAEKSYVWRDPATGIWLKSRIDMTTNRTIGDIKGTRRKTLYHLTMDLRTMGYDMQIALAAQAHLHLRGEPIENACLVFIHNLPPYHVMPIEVGEGAIVKAGVKLRHAINLTAHGLKTGEWPGPYEGIPKYDPPDWEAQKIAELQEAGELPLAY